jgi:hypothetical protein
LGAEAHTRSMCLGAEPLLKLPTAENIIHCPNSRIKCNFPHHQNLYLTTRPLAAIIKLSFHQPIIIMNLPTKTPAEVLDISPEALEVANSYLQLQDVQQVSEQLDMPLEIIGQILGKKEVKAYIDHVFFNVGFNNRFKMRAAMDAVIKKKFQELEDSEMGSTKDIADLLALSHKMTMEEMSKQIELEKLHAINIKNQVNVQINDGGSKYSSLIQQLLTVEDK